MLQALGSIDGQLDISGNTALPGLPGSFAALRTVTGNLFLSSNGFLTLDGSFPVRPLIHVSSQGRHQKKTLSDQRWRQRRKRLVEITWLQLRLFVLIY